MDNALQSNEHETAKGCLMDTEQYIMCREGHKGKKESELWAILTYLVLIKYCCSLSQLLRSAALIDQ